MPTNEMEDNPDGSGLDAILEAYVGANCLIRSNKLKAPIPDDWNSIRLTVKQEHINDLCKRISEWFPGGTFTIKRRSGHPIIVLRKRRGASANWWPLWSLVDFPAVETVEFLSSRKQRASGDGKFSRPRKRPKQPATADELRAERALQKLIRQLNRRYPNG
ncbi:MAG: hypothetical protein IT462_11475 [Planctomycetes bacterium]|nr:hypothetical protein [Planctomycetota bacterium]